MHGNGERRGTEQSRERGGDGFDLGLERQREEVAR